MCKETSCRTTRVLARLCHNRGAGSQVTALALCKYNKSDMFLRRLRHRHQDALFWDHEDVPEESLSVLQVLPAHDHLSPTSCNQVLGRVLVACRGEIHPLSLSCL